MTRHLTQRARDRHSCTPYRPRLQGILTLLAAGSLGAGVIGDVQAQAASINGQIAYTQCEPSSLPFFPDQCDIWIMNADGTGQTNLTRTTDENEVGPAWSPDGRRIAFFKGWDSFTLVVIDADGTNMTTHPTAITSPGPATPTWSPGGTQVAFQASLPDTQGGTRADIVSMNLATGVETVVTGLVDFGGIFLDAQEIEPAWSPDGQRIAFASVRPEWYADPVTGEPTEGAQWEIVVVDPDGSGSVVVSAGDDGTDRARYLEEDRAPAWSPDGSMLVFMSQAQIPACCGPWQVWAVNRDGTGATNLTNDETVNDQFAAWSPDGTQLIFSRSNGEGGTDLYAIAAPTSLPAALPVAAARTLAMPSVAPAPPAAAEPATRLTFGANAGDPDWGRNPDAPLFEQQFSLFTAVTPLNRGAGGIVASRPAGIWCGVDCTEAYPPGTSLSLTAVPRQGSMFVSWAGACTGRVRPCTVSMDDVKAVKARFLRLR